ncbi:MAG: hypothetical protein KKE20_02325 [Nanoarchaeota archaeon]|nr:hypothetical protein [Nanoarchaeota archaeon]
MSYHTNQKPILLHRGRNRKKRVKTFKTEEGAKKWAQENKLKEFKIMNLRNADSKKNKFRIETA